MTVGIIGLGMIGGSFAEDYAKAGHKVLAFDRSPEVLDAARLLDIAQGELSAENIGECELILAAIYPEGIIQKITEWAPYINKNAVVIDCCGVKRAVCDALFPVAKQYGFTFVGGHPMAGNQYSGLRYAHGDMFKGAPMVLVPPVYDDIALLDRVRTLLAPPRFGRFSVTTAEDHDAMIAFTSQMAHLVSSAYIKSPTAGRHKGFSAGSYKDMTRVARLNPEMWSELFLDNHDNILRELDSFISELGKYREAIAAGDRETLRALLAEGRRRKEEVDGL